MTSIKSEYIEKRVRKQVGIPPNLKNLINSIDIFSDLWGWYRCLELQTEYSERREYYAKLAAANNVVYNETDIARAVKDRLISRGYNPIKRRFGEIHTFVYVPLYSWAVHLLPDFYELGPVTHFDYLSLGFKLEELKQVNKLGAKRRKELERLLLNILREKHKTNPVDWLFCYGAGCELSPEIIKEIAESFGIPIVNMSLDDKQSWAGPLIDGRRAGTVDITSSYDLFMTSARVCCEWHLLEGGRPIYLPEGFSRAVYRPMEIKKDITVSFIGEAYGFRKPVVRFLRAKDVKIETFGPGWGTKSVWGDEQATIFNRSIINLGMGGIGYSESLTNVKTRDFEIPGTGGGVYLTSFNSDLAHHFEIGKEILCYRNRDEMVELIRYYLAHPDEAREIAHRGRERCLREHRWLHRYQKICKVLGIMNDNSNSD